MAAAATGGGSLDDDRASALTSTFTAETLRRISEEKQRQQLDATYRERLEAIYRECLLPAANASKFHARFDSDTSRDHEVIGVPDYKVLEILRDRGFKIMRDPLRSEGSVATYIISWR